MVGVVIVSHSRALAEAVVALARPMAAPEVRIAIAAGVGDGRAEFGTDAVEIAEAIQSVLERDGVLADGVVVLMDLGSAVLSAQTALDLLPDEARSRVRVCPAPLVEGAMVAIAQAGLGGDVETVCGEAARALSSKAEQVGADPVDDRRPVQVLSTAFPLVETVTLKNPHGLHARPAARFVRTASAYDADVVVTKMDSGRAPASARSLNQLMMLGAVQGDQLIITVVGRQAIEAVMALRRLVEDGFGEESSPGRGFEPAGFGNPVGASARGAPVTVPYTGIGISEGYAVAPLCHYRKPMVEVAEAIVDDAGSEMERLDRAVEFVGRNIQQRRLQVSAAYGDAQAGIFDAHGLILEDPALLARARSLVADAHRSAPWAWQTAIGEVAGAYHALSDSYLRQRAGDVEDIGNQVMAALARLDDGQPVADVHGIVVADELTPTQIAGLDVARVLGLVTIAGGANSHASILTRALGIPAVSGVDPAVLDAHEGMVAGVDGFSGAVWLNPPGEVMADLLARRQAWLEQARLLREASQQTTMTRDGHRVEVAANLGSVADARVAVANGAEAVGVLRTEFLYLTRSQPPSEDEQTAVLRQIAETMRPRPVVVRTLDVGGDKAIPYLPLPWEANPFLGVRAIRLSFQRPDLFITQVKAILRAGDGLDVRVLLPMISLVEEIGQARQMIEQAHTDLEARCVAHAWPVWLGAMIETPSAALLADDMAAQVDFLSIGTNDLTQYTLAAERGNTGVAYLSDALHPSVLRLIRRVGDAARRQGKRSGVCGEMAADAMAVPVLIGLGIDELSLNPVAIPMVKDVIRRLDMPAARALAEAAIQAVSAVEVRRLAGEFVKRGT